MYSYRSKPAARRSEGIQEALSEKNQVEDKGVANISGRNRKFDKAK